MRFAYADPPYLGQAQRHYAKEAAAAGRVASEVDHEGLIASLAGYDGWALSLSSPSLRIILPMCPTDVRVMAWVKPFASFKPGVNPGYCWEPVIVKRAPDRKLGRDVPTIRDYVSCNITLRRGVSGAKPDAFCRWLFDVMGMERDDEFDDLFPGSGAVANTHSAWQEQGALAGVSS